MIIDKIENAELYYSLSPRLEKAFEFLRNLSTFTPGKQEIDGENIIAILIDTEGFSEEKAVFESHRKYIDLHFTVEGSDRIGWKPLENSVVKEEYNEENDYMLFEGPALNWNLVNKGYFAIFFPEDVHAAAVESGKVKKVVVKILI